jgi:sugar fermentation stimulation protein A
MITFQPPLQPATLIKRYKRFLADVVLADGTITTIHVANTGAMTGCGNEGDTIWYSTSENPKRKYPLSWELTQISAQQLVCVNTLRANQLVADALSNQIITELTGYHQIQSEVSYGQEQSKIDFLLTSGNQADAYIEVKSVTLLAENSPLGYFPDAVTQRGQKHLRELIEIVALGKRGILLFAVLHSGIEQVAVAEHIDPTYAQLFYQAIAAGVEVYAYKAAITPEFMTLTHPIHVKLN